MTVTTTNIRLFNEASIFCIEDDMLQMTYYDGYHTDPGLYKRFGILGCHGPNMKWHPFSHSFIHGII